MKSQQGGPVETSIHGAALPLYAPAPKTQKYEWFIQKSCIDRDTVKRYKLDSNISK